MSVEKAIQRKWRGGEWKIERKKKEKSLSISFLNKWQTLPWDLSNSSPLLCECQRQSRSSNVHTHTPAADKRYLYHNLTGAIMMEVWQIQRALRVQALPRLDGRLINLYCDLVDGGEMTWQLIWEKFRRWPDREQLNLMQLLPQFLGLHFK